MKLLDTDVASFFFRGDSRADLYVSHLKGEQLALSFMSVAELYAWAERNHWGVRRRAELETLILEHYTVLGFEVGLCKEWAKVRAEGFKQGRPIAVQDAWVAASARYFDLALVSHNQAHFTAVGGLTLISETG